MTTILFAAIPRQERVRQLLKPSPETILNDSLSLSMWFAARGRGRLICSGECDLNVLPELYTSPSWLCRKDHLTPNPRALILSSQRSTLRFVACCQQAQSSTL
ncbi:unnamed protein product [Mesocestoides corti]|uniref:Transcriptional regulator n=1 Tax=Mesocestoides corti TaxID=53468 RepID=A0A0R3UK28_MESCO|nr:unnamed protein product [Mesocestoides corti]